MMIVGGVGFYCPVGQLASALWGAHGILWHTNILSTNNKMVIHVSVCYNELGNKWMIISKKHKRKGSKNM